MQQVKVIERRTKSGFEDEMNEFLDKMKDQEILDIKYSTSFDNSTVSHSALILYKV